MSHVVTGAVVLAVGIVAAAGASRVRWPAVRYAAIAVSGVVAVIGVLATVLAVVVAAGDRRPNMVDLGPGITYEKMVLDEPRHQVLHLAIVDLDNECLALDTSVPDVDGVVRAETGTGFAARTGAIVSINAAFFYPFRENPFWATYPRPGDEVTALGRVVSDGRATGNPTEWPSVALAVTDGRARIGPYDDDVDVSVPGRRALVEDGRNVAPASDPYPRAIVGVDLDTNHLILVVSDGKQRGYAEGSTYHEVAELLLRLGIDDAMELDGGGSATMAATIDGRATLLNRPRNQWLPGRQRPVATHLGVRSEAGCDH